MAVKNYGIHDKWTDLDKLNNVDIKSVDGVIESVKINGEEAGGGGGSNGEFKIANITWTNLPESFDDHSKCSGCLLVKTADGFEDYYDIYDFSELILQWDDEWATSPKAIVTTKQPENVGDIAVWLQPYQAHDFAVVSGDAFIWNRGVIIYGDCTLTIS